MVIKAQKPFADRRHAGRLLAEALGQRKSSGDVAILGLPRGGIPVAFEVARSLHAPMDIFVVRKLGFPPQPELAMGAIASGGIKVLNRAVVDRLNIPAELVEQVAADEAGELARRERAYRGGLPALPIDGKSIILIDDGLATGATMRAAVKAVLQSNPTHLTVAVPVAASSTSSQMAQLCDEVVTLIEPAAFYAVGEWYDDFSQTTDDEVRHLFNLLRSEADPRLAC